MTMVIINPGTGPVGAYGDRVLLKHAIANVRSWVRDALSEPDTGGRFSWERDPKRDDEGRYGFRLVHMRRSRAKGAKPTDLVECRHVLDMPGLPLAQVRYTGAKGQNIWHFPRMYTDESSWVWRFSFPHCDEQVEPSESVAGGSNE